MPGPSASTRAANDVQRDTAPEAASSARLREPREPGAGTEGHFKFRESILRELETGKLPQLLLDKWQIPDPNSAPQRAFEQNVLKILREVAPPDFWDFDKNPVRVLYSESRQPNAWCVTQSEPPVIVITRGMFRNVAAPLYTDEYFTHLTRGLPDMGVAPGSMVQPISTVSDLVAVAFHELVHAKEKIVRGLHANSKWEEAKAYALPLEAMHRAGLNPHAMFRVMMILAAPANTELRRAQSFFDPHPTPENTLKLIRTALTALDYERGQLPTAEALPEGIPEKFAALTSRAAEFHFEHSARKELPANYEELSTRKKIECVKAVVSATDTHRWDRITVATQLVDELDLTSRDMRVMVQFRDEIVASAGTRSGAATAAIYFAIQRAINEEPDQLPTQFKDAAAAVENFKKSITGKAPLSEVEQSATELIRIIDADPILKTESGKVFAAFLDWPNFPTVKFHETAGWNPVRELCGQSETVLHAAVFIGLQRDPLVIRHLQAFPELLLRHKPGEVDNGAAALPEISTGPRVSMLSGQTGYLGSATWDDKGKLLDVSFDDLEKVDSFGTLHKRSKYYSDRDFGGVIYDSIGELVSKLVTKESLTEVERSFLINAEKNLTSGHASEVAMDQASLAKCLREQLLELAPQMFSIYLKLYLGNEKVSLKEWAARQDHVVNLLEEILSKEGGAAKLSTISFSATSLIPSSELGKSPDKDEGGKVQRKAAAASESVPVPSSYPVLNFVMNAPEGVLTVERKRELLADSLSRSQYVHINDGTSGGIYQVLIHAGKIPGMNPNLAEIAGAFRANNLKAPEVQLLAKRAAVLLGLEPAESRVNQAIEILSAAKGFPWRDCTELAEFVEKNGPQFLAHIERSLVTGDVAGAARAWATLSAQDALTLAERRKVLTSLMKGVAALGPGSQRLEARVQVLSALPEEDYELHLNLCKGFEHDLRKVHGVDDNSAAYRRDLLRDLNSLGEIRDLKRKSELFEEISRTVISQSDLAASLSEIAGKRPKTSERAEVFSGVVADGFLNLTLHNESATVPQRRSLMHFLLDDLDSVAPRAFLSQFFAVGKDTLATPDNVNETWKVSLDHKMLKDPKDAVRQIQLGVYAVDHPVVMAKLDPEIARRIQEFHARFSAGARSMHIQFSTSTLAVRTGIMHELLFPDGLDPEIFTSVRDHALVKMSPGNTARDQGVRDLGRRYLDAVPDIRKEHLVVATLISSSHSQEKSVGETIVDVASALDPAAVKLVQRMRGMRDIPMDIRHDTAEAVFRVGEPPRREVLKWVDAVKESLEQEYRKSLKEAGRPHEGVVLEHKDAVVGCGSMGVNIRVRFSNGDSKILYLLKPYAVERGETGFETLGVMVKKMPKDDLRRPILGDVVEAAGKRLQLEGSTAIAKEQYDLGIEMHRGGKVSAFGKEFGFNAPKVHAAQTIRTPEMRSYSYFLMDEVPGKHLVEILNEKTPDAATKAETKALCASILCRELHLYLKHFFIEPDRNEGNIKVDERLIGHIDFKALRVTKWSEAAIKEVAPLIVDTVIEQFGGKSTFADFLDKLGSKSAKLSPEARDLVTELETGLMSLSPYAERLDNDELAAVCIGAIEAGVHPVLAQEVSQRVPAAYRGIAASMLTESNSGNFIRRQMFSKALDSLGAGKLSEHIGKVRVVS